MGRDGVGNFGEISTSAAQIPDALHILRDGRWRRAPGTKNADQVAVSPFDPQHLVWANENSGQWWQSRDGGTTSVDFGNERRAAGESSSEERRVGKECVSTGRSRWSPSH